MKKISKIDLRIALLNVGVDCEKISEGYVESLIDLSETLGILLSGLADEILVQDPTGNSKFAIRLQPSSAFKSGILLLGRGEALLFGDDRSGGVLFVSGKKDGRVGLAYELPEDILKLDFTEPSEGKFYWELELVEWLNHYKENGRKIFE